ncbi:MAG TPA: tetratricopeptide repeat protein [Geopsychrobacteraceae bacterium]|nr:tetratricopeptide repeat protein [Geopsychrobacteraceae bacterium]
MKNTTPIKRKQFHAAALIAGLFLSGVLSACAPPPATSPTLSKEMALLKQQQLQQQQTLQFIQQQLAQLQGQPPVESPAEPTADDGVQQDPVPVAATDEIADLVAAASSYLEAFSALTMGRYEFAKNGFNSFLDNFPAHNYAPNARYWLAEAELALGQNTQAEENLLLIANNPDQANKAPAALSRLAQLYLQQNAAEQAEDILHQLRTRFPESREAQQFNRSDQSQ